MPVNLASIVDGQLHKGRVGIVDMEQQLDWCGRVQLLPDGDRLDCSRPLGQQPQEKPTDKPPHAPPRPTVTRSASTNVTTSHVPPSRLRSLCASSKAFGRST